MVTAAPVVVRVAPPVAYAVILPTPSNALSYTLVPSAAKLSFIMLKLAGTLLSAVLALPVSLGARPTTRTVVSAAPTDALVRVVNPVVLNIVPGSLPLFNSNMTSVVIGVIFTLAVLVVLMLKAGKTEYR